MIDDLFLKTVLMNAFEREFELQKITVDMSSNPPIRVVLATNQQHEQFLFRIQSQTMDTREILKAIRSSLESGFVSLRFRFHDDAPYEKRRLFRIAEEASKSAVAFQWQYQTKLWVGDDLPIQLKWNNRVPVSERLVFAEFIPMNQDVFGVKNFWEIQRWKEFLEENGSEATVMVRNPANSFNELIPARLIAVDEDEHRVICVAKRDSLLSPLIFGGAKFTCMPSQIEPDTQLVQRLL